MIEDDESERFGVMLIILSPCKSAYVVNVHLYLFTRGFSDSDSNGTYSTAY